MINGPVIDGSLNQWRCSTFFFKGKYAVVGTLAEQANLMCTIDNHEVVAIEPTE
jgi:hypothetical protein